MESASLDKTADEVAIPTPASSSAKSDAPASAASANPGALASNPATASDSKPTDRKQSTAKKSKSKSSKKQGKKKSAKDDDSDDSDSSSDDDDDADSDDSSSSSDDDGGDNKSKKRRSNKHSRRKHHKSTKSTKRSAKHDDSSDSDDSDSSESDSDDSSSSTDNRKRKNKSKTKRRRARRSSTSKANHDDDDEDADNAETSTSDALKQIQIQLAALQAVDKSKKLTEGSDGSSRKKSKSSSKSSKKKKKQVKRGSTLEFKRVDQLWDKELHDFRLKESAEVQDDEFDEFVFTVRRRFNWENKYSHTLVDIKSKSLRDALQAVMADVRGISLVEEQPSVDPNMLFLYLEEFRTYTKATLKAKLKTEKKKKAVKRLKTMRRECKLLIKYLDEDYADTKKTLYPMLEAGNITFDLLWALFKPNTIAYTPTYGSTEHPRCFKVDLASKESSFTRGEWYCIEGRYLEYDGKSFGLGDFEVDINAFKGARKITSLSTYPLQYHTDPDGLKKTLIERGKRFVSLEGMNYRFHKGLAFMKKKKQIAKVNINGRIMVDPAIFRRINPNYPISNIKPKDGDEDCYPADSDNECSCSCSEEEDSDKDRAHNEGDDEALEKTKMKVIVDDNHNVHVVSVPIDADGNELQVEKLDALPEGAEGKATRVFSEEELVIASPVVLGFAFSEKLWLEFSLSGVCDIDWNEGAFESLVLPDNQKDIVKALVESHKFHAAKTIDDVVQGKGKGLVAVLHGPPGTGKTLTAEGIAELLKCPLYMVSAGELGTDSRMLESELQKILDIAHSWGAVLLLDEADVFLEKRQVHDIHRNALVSIFLRLLEYFQGILFLTTNRVETFDDAFQSRIHVALRYGELTARAKKAVWKMFLDRVRAMEGVESVDWTEEDYEILSRKAMNGRQIKNTVRTAQALAVNNDEKLSMEHIKRVLDVAESFEQDLKGGTGYRDAMRQYT